MPVAAHHSSHMSHYILCCRSIGDHCECLIPLGDELVPVEKNVVSSKRVDRATLLLVCNRVAPPFDSIKSLLRLFTYVFSDFCHRNIFALRLFLSIRGIQVTAILLVTCIVLCIDLRLAVLQNRRNFCNIFSILNILVIDANENVYTDSYKRKT